jgi:uncharacterized protein (TIGR03118 family)
MNLVQRMRCAGAAGMAAMAVLFVVVLPGCGSDTSDPSAVKSLSGAAAAAFEKANPLHVSQVTLVANVSGYGANRIDASLENAWGIAITPTGIVWISSNHGGVSEVYDSNGNAKRSPVTIPTADSSGGGSPTGIVFNSSGDFANPATGEAGRFIFATEEGIIAAWGTGASAKVVVNRSGAGAVYKGLALASNGDGRFLYATNFHGGAVEVFDSHFNMVATPGFQDPGIPAGFAPFGIQTIHGNLFVTYAKQKGPDNMDDEGGAGNGFVDVFTPGGKLITRFASRGALNSPWGLTRVPEEGFRNLGDAILVGNFGDGRINIFSEDGRFRGQLADSAGNPVTVPGLWALTFGPSQNNDSEGDGDSRGDESVSAPRLFFTAGPNDESDGIFGYFSGSRPHHHDEESSD